MSTVSKIIRVDYSVAPEPFPWKGTYVHNLPQRSGLWEIDIGSIRLRIEPRQQKRVRGQKVFSTLWKTGLIKSCLDLRAAEEFLKNPQLLPKSWDGKNICFWRTFCRDLQGNLFVPCIAVSERKGTMYWRYLRHHWYANEPAATLIA